MGCWRMDAMTVNLGFPEVGSLKAGQESGEALPCRRTVC